MSKKNKDKTITKIYFFGEKTDRVITIVGKIVPVIDPIPPLEGKYYIIILGWAIQRPGDTVSTLGETIARGRANTDLNEGQSEAILVNKPSVKTLGCMAEDFYHYIVNHPEEFYVEKKPEKKIVETE